MTFIAELFTHAINVDGMHIDGRISSTSGEPSMQPEQYSRLRDKVARYAFKYRTKSGSTRSVASTNQLPKYIQASGAYEETKGRAAGKDAKPKAKAEKKAAAKDESPKSLAEFKDLAKQWEGATDAKEKKAIEKKLIAGGAKLIGKAGESAEFSGRHHEGSLDSVGEKITVSRPGWEIPAANGYVLMKAKTGAKDAAAKHPHQMTVADLRKHATSIGMKGHSKLKKGDLLAAVAKHQMANATPAAAKPSKPAPAAESPQKPLHKMKVAELKEVAKRRGVSGFEKLKKGDLVNAIHQDWVKQNAPATSGLGRQEIISALAKGNDLKPAAAPSHATTAMANAAETHRHADEIEAAFDKLNTNKHDLVHFAKLREALPHLSKDQFDRAAKLLRKQKRFGFSQGQSQTGWTQQEQDSVIPEVDVRHTHMTNDYTEERKRHSDRRNLANQAMQARKAEIAAKETSFNPGARPSMLPIRDEVKRRKEAQGIGRTAGKPVKPSHESPEFSATPELEQPVIGKQSTPKPTLSAEDRQREQATLARKQRRAAKVRGYLDDHRKQMAEADKRNREYQPSIDARHENDVTSAYHELSGGREGVPVRLKHLREKLAHLSREDQDSALLRLAVNKKGILNPIEDPQKIKKEDHDAALRTSTGEVRHEVLLGRTD